MRLFGRIADVGSSSISIGQAVPCGSPAAGASSPLSEPAFARLLPAGVRAISWCANPASTAAFFDLGLDDRVARSRSWPPPCKRRCILVPAVDIVLRTVGSAATLSDA